MLKFILGTAGVGKTHNCILEALSNRAKEREVIFLVPEQYTLQTERNIINKSGKKATDIRVLSFKRLAYEVVQNKPVHDEISKIITLFKIIKETPLSFYKGALIDDGFLKSLSATISELYNADVSPHTLKGLPFTDERTKEKIEDIAKILESYIKATDNFVTVDNALISLYKDIPEIIRGAYIYIDEFNSFSEIEFKILNRIIFLAAEVTICLKTDSITAPEEGELFFETKKTLLGFKNYNYTYTILEENKREENLKLFACENFYDEVYCAVNEIMTAVKTEGYRYKDIAVMAPDSYEAAIKLIFKEYDIPFFIDKTRIIKNNPLAIFIYSLFDVLCTNFNKSLFLLLRTGFLSLSDNEVDILENYSLKYGIKGFRWKRPFKEAFPESLRKKLIDEIAPFENIFKEHNKIKHICREFFALLLARRRKLIKFTKTAENVTTYKTIVSIFENISSFLGEEETTLKEFASIIKIALNSSKIGKVPEFIDSILVGNIERTRLGSVKKVICLGNEDTVYNESGLFLDYEKKLLDSHGINIRGKEHVLFSSELNFYSIYKAPTNSLIVTYPKKNLYGKQIATPFIISKLKKEVDEAHFKNYIISKTFYKDAGTTFKLNLAYDIYKDTFKTSVSRLETYVKCPFSYFASYNLGLRERSTNEIDNLKAGRIYHEILKAAHPYFKGEENDLDAIIERACVPDIDEDSTIMKNQILQIKKTAKASIIELKNMLDEEEFDLYKTEMKFDSIEIEIEGGVKFVLSGIVDRIDVMDTEEGSFIKIIDYKSSEKKLKEEDIRSGMQLQLLLYLKTIMQTLKSEIVGKELLPGGVFYFKIQNPFGESKEDLKKKFAFSGFADADFKSLMEGAENKAKSIVGEILSGDISQNPHKTKDFNPCEYCAYKSACNFNQKGFYETWVT